MEQHKSIDLIRQLEEMPKVDFVDPVVGKRDMVIMVDAPAGKCSRARRQDYAEGDYTKGIYKPSKRGTA